MPRENKYKRLEQYKKKRDFSTTSEPKGKVSKSRSSTLKFVIQKHAASHLHYDLRLEMEGVLKSWALPKGPSLNVEDKRLAVQTEDHPLDYANFEGTIPSGHYGAGTVLVWDQGTYRSSSDTSLIQDYKKGHLSFILKGKKLKGSFVLQRFKEDDPPHWLLIKLKDEYADKTHNVLKKNKSVVSGKNLKEINKRKSHE